jgi:dimethylhistidine N-methyltransferase
MITTDHGVSALSFAEDVERGLSSRPKYLPCVYLYDYRGSLLFENICRLPEYYLTRAESRILRTHSGEIASFLLPDSLLVELGSGSCTKTRFILEELLRRNGRVTYSPIDVSQEMLRKSAELLLERYDALKIISIAAEYREGLRQLDSRTGRPKLVLWLGSSIGNFEFEAGVRFLRNVVGSLSTEDLFLIGFDLQKDRRILEQAYNDSRGITADFNLNLLSRINRELGGEFDLGRFSHQAFYREERSRIEMHLRSICDQEVRIADLDRYYHFDRDETIHTENSRKYSLKAIATLAERTGLEIVKQWLDPRRYFNLTLFRPAPR